MLQGEQSLPYFLTGPNPYPWIRWWYVLVAPRASGPEENLCDSSAVGDFAQSA